MAMHIYEHLDDTDVLRRTRSCTQTLLIRLTDISKKHPEIFSRLSRKHLATALHRSFIVPVNGYDLPDDYGLNDEKANLAVKSALIDYLYNIREELNIRPPSYRSMVFGQHFLNRSVKGVDLFNFFGAWSSDEDGIISNVLLHDIPENEVAKYLDEKVTVNPTVYGFLAFIGVIAILFSIVFSLVRLSNLHEEGYLISQIQSLYRIEKPINTISEKHFEDSQAENARNDRYIIKYYSSNLTRSEIIMHYQKYAKNNYWCCFKELADKPHTDYGWGEKYTVYQWSQYSKDLRLMMFDKEQESPQKLNHYMLGFFW